MVEDEGPEIIYHYCGVEAFMSILKTRTIRLTSLDQTNDSTEGWEIIKSLRAKEEVGDADKQTTDELEETIRACSEAVLGFAFCMSEDGDLLSQWRGYAQDGMGFSVGFDRKKLEELCEKRSYHDLGIFSTKKILYSVNARSAIAKELFESIKNKSGAGVLNSFFLAAASRHAIKNIAFSEEKEWRLHGLFMRTFRGSSASGNQVELIRKKMEFGRRHNSIVPYYNFDVDGDGIIKEVILGPRNVTPDKALEIVLISYGHANVEYRRSTAPYLPS